MAYRVNAQFKDGSTNAQACVVDAPLPRRGDTVTVARHGLAVCMRVIAIWTPSSKFRGDGLVMVEATEI